jgi:hypothetical protein
MKSQIPISKLLNIFKLQAPTSKLQRNFKPQAPNRLAAPMKFGAWCFPGAWILVLAAFARSAYRLLRWTLTSPWYALGFLLFSLRALALTPIVYNASDFTGTTNNNPVTLTSLMKIQVNNHTMLVGLPINFTPTNGAYATNVYAGLYNLTLQGIPSGVTCLIPDTTNPQNLASCVISNLGLFSATNLNAVITNPVTLLAGTNIQMTTNGFAVTISGVVTNLNGMTLSNAILINPSFSGLTSNEIPGLSWTNIDSGLPTTLFGYGITDAQKTNSNLTTLAANNGGALTNVYAAGLSNGLFAVPVFLTNVNNQEALVVAAPLDLQLTTGDTAIVILSPTPRATSYGGFFFPVGGTNPVYNGITGVPFSVLSNGQTNYIYDVKAGQLGSVPANGVNINNGTVGFFCNPGWPFTTGGFYSGFQNDWLYWDPTNWVVHFPTPNGTANQDPRSTGVNDTFTIDAKNSIVTTSNLVAKSPSLFINNGAIGAGSCLAIGTTNTTSGERLLVQATGTSFGPSSNYAEIMIQSTTGNDGPSLRLSAHGGSDFNLVSTGSGDGTGANYFVIYSFGNSQYEFEIDPRGNLIVPNGGAKIAKTLSTASITCTNAPTFCYTNSAPLNTTTPVLWRSETNTTTGQVYKTPLYQ